MKLNTKTLLYTFFASSLLVCTPSCDSDDVASSKGDDSSKDESGSTTDSLNAGDTLTFNFEDEIYTIEIIGDQQLNYVFSADGNTELQQTNIPFTFTRDGKQLNLNSSLTTISQDSARDFLNEQLQDSNSAISKAVANLSEPATESEIEAVLRAVYNTNQSVILDYLDNGDVFLVTSVTLNGEIGGNASLSINGPILDLKDNSVTFSGNTGYTDSVA